MDVKLNTRNTDFPAGKAPQRTMLKQFAEYAEFSGVANCCGCKPFNVFGRSRHIVDDREYHAEAFCTSCSAAVGTIIAKPDTIFGIEEDDRVLNGRCRVY